VRRTSAFQGDPVGTSAARLSAAALDRSPGTKIKEIVMGFLQLIPATELSATYYGSTRTLQLRAQGQAQNYTSGIHFVATISPEGRSNFRLMGWVGPIGKGTTPYTHLQNFDNMEFPGAYVEIADAGHPGGLAVHVAIVPDAEAGAAAPTPDVRHVAVGGDLDLRASVWAQPGASQSLERDAAYLALESAGIQNPSGGPEIVWNLRALKAGETQVKLVSSGGINPIITSRTIRVIIGPR
jgi:hypothetical protein